MQIIKDIKPQVSEDQSKLSIINNRGLLKVWFESIGLSADLPARMVEWPVYALNPRPGRQREGGDGGGGENGDTDLACCSQRERRKQKLRFPQPVTLHCLPTGSKSQLTIIVHGLPLVTKKFKLLVPIWF